ncbi:unnamed protein product [Sphagnum troendelagicum]|uniref:Uncharacterized protein n=1 Tax=Sphagnum troendelagicum TaxID=128251 RepID=A0ABP0T927_9BRYO
MRKRRQPLHPLSFSAIAEVQTLPHAAAATNGPLAASRTVRDSPQQRIAENRSIEAPPIRSSVMGCASSVVGELAIEEEVDEIG